MFSNSTPLRLRRICGAVLLAAVTTTSWAQKAATIIVPFPAGGTTDIIARTMAEGLGRELGQTFIVENKPGAGGNVGAEFVARAKPDGSTLMVSTAGPLAINPHLYARLGYDPLKDFTSIGKLATVPIMLVANPQQPFTNVAEFIAYAKAHPGKLSYGSQGNGTTSHLTMELLKNQAGIQITHIPYRGSAPAANDLMGGVVQVAFDNSPSTLPFVQSGRMRALGIASAKRSPQLKELPAISETVPGFESDAWFAIVGPNGMSVEMQARLNAAMNKTLQRPDLQARFTALGVTLVGGTPQVLSQFIREENDKWAKVIKAANVQLD